MKKTALIPTIILLTACGPARPGQAIWASGAPSTTPVDASSTGEASKATADDDTIETVILRAEDQPTVTDAVTRSIAVGLHCALKTFRLPGGKQWSEGETLGSQTIAF